MLYSWANFYSYRDTAKSIKSTPSDIERPRWGAQRRVVVELEDPTSAGETTEELNQDVVQLSEKPFRARRITVSFGQGVAIFHQSHSHLRTRTNVEGDSIPFVATGPHSKETRNGFAIGPAVLFTSPARTEVSIVVEPGSQSVTLLVSRPSLEQQLKHGGLTQVLLHVSGEMHLEPHSVRFFQLGETHRRRRSIGSTHL